MAGRGRTSATTSGSSCFGNADFNPISALARATMVGDRPALAPGRWIRLMMEGDPRDRRRRGPSARTSPSTNASTAPNGSASTRPPCSRTWRRTNPSNWMCILAAVVELADLTDTKAPTLRAVHAVADLLSTKVGLAPIAHAPTAAPGPDHSNPPPPWPRLPRPPEPEPDGSGAARALPGPLRTHLFHPVLRPRHLLRRGSGAAR